MTPAVRTAPFALSRPDELEDALAARMRELGYLFFPELVPIGDVLALRDEVLEVARDLGWLDPSAPRASATSVPGLAMGAYDDPRWVELLRRVLPSPTLDALRRSPALVRVVSIALGAVATPAAGDICRVVSSDEPSHTTPPHQDAHYLRGHASLATAWLPLGACPVELGPLAVLPGSHTRGLLPHRGEGLGGEGCATPRDAVWHAADLDCGDVLIVGGLTVHRALPHRMGRKLRLSVDLRYTP